MSYIITFKNEFPLGGLTWQFIFLAENIYYANLKQMKFYIEDTTFPFKYNKGWHDYFNSLDSIQDLDVIPSPLEVYNRWNHNLSSIPLKIYRTIFDSIIILQPYLQKMLENIQNKYGLISNEYDALMIRRGDKLHAESAYVSVSEYLDLLVNKNSKKIFLQTDDYGVYLEALDYLHEKYEDKNIELITICPSWKRGTITYKYEYDKIMLERQTTRNKEYIEYLLKHNICPIDQLPADKMKEHNDEVIIGLEICRLSRYFSCDFQTNVTRYIYIRHQNPDNVLVIKNGKCPDFDTPCNPIHNDFGMK
jgi:hypothetical protein